MAALAVDDADDEGEAADWSRADSGSGRSSISGGEAAAPPAADDDVVDVVEAGLFCCWACEFADVEAWLDVPAAIVWW